jgi:hypothetical protein
LDSEALARSSGHLAAQKTSMLLQDDLAILETKNYCWIWIAVDRLEEK